jgi:G6PDH family F420-dependent oxidoreductase
MLGTIAGTTQRIGLATGVTCPTFRYHPAIIAQAAATVALLSDNRFTLGIGSGERLNEHIVGDFPGIRKRQERLREALEIINLLWQGGYQSYDGRYFQLDDARVWDLPEQLPVLAVAAGGADAAAIAAELGSGLFTTEPKAELVQAYQAKGGDGPMYAEVPMAWAPDDETAIQAVLETSRWALTGWKVMSELPNPVNFDAASATVRAEDVTKQFAVGPDVEKYVEHVQQYVDAGYDHIVLQNAGPDPQGFVYFFTKELADRIRTLTPSS